MRRLLPTASRLELASHCIGSAVLPSDEVASPYASRGTAIHAYLETVNRVGRDEALAQADESTRAACAAIDLDGLPVDPSQWAAEVSLAFDVVTGRARELDRSKARSYDDATDDDVVGTADIVGLTSAAVIVCDWKTGHGHLPPPEDHRQLRFLALAAARAYKRSHAIVELIRLREDGTAWRQRGELDLFSLVEIAEEVRALAADVRRWRAADTEPPLRVGDWCSMCPAFRRCPAQVQSALALVGVEVVDTVDAREALVRRFEAALTDENAVELHGKVASLRAFVGLLEEVIERYAATRPVRFPDGRVLGPVETKRDSLDGKTVWRVLQERYGEELAWEATELKATKSGIEREMRKVATKTGAKITHLNREVLTEVARRGGVHTGYAESVRLHKPKEGGR